MLCFILFSLSSLLVSASFDYLPTTCLHAALTRGGRLRLIHAASSPNGLPACTARPRALNPISSPNVRPACTARPHALPAYHSHLPAKRLASCSVYVLGLLRAACRPSRHIMHYAPRCTACATLVYRMCLSVVVCMPCMHFRVLLAPHTHPLSPLCPALPCTSPLAPLQSRGHSQCT